MIEKKVVLITGGSRGIGKALVEKFTAEGWRAATCSTHLDELRDSRAAFKFACDVGRSDEVEKGIKEVISALGRIDAIVNNAGLSGTNSLDPHADDDLWHQIMNVNLHGTYYVCKQAAPHLPNGAGRVVNIASVLALRGVPDQTAYCAAKHGVLGFTRAYAHFLSSRGITVNAVCPGWVDTAMAASRMKEIGEPREALLKAVPLGRIIQPSEIAGFVYFLCASPDAAMITGQALTMDGGTLA